MELMCSAAPGGLLEETTSRRSSSKATPADCFWSWERPTSAGLSYNAEVKGQRAKKADKWGPVMDLQGLWLKTRFLLMGWRLEPIST